MDILSQNSNQITGSRVNGAISLDDEKFAREFATKIDRFLNNEYDHKIEVMLRLKLISESEANEAKERRPANDFWEKSLAFERLSYLAQAKAISGNIFIEALDYIRQVKQLLPNLANLATVALEMEKIATTGAIKQAEAQKYLNQYAKGDGQAGSEVIQQYKNLLKEKISHAAERGLFTGEEAQNFSQIIMGDNFTVIGTPRQLTGENEMAWANIMPYWTRLEKWRLLEELYKARLISDEKLRNAVQVLRSDGALPKEQEKLEQGLERLHYIRGKGLIKDEGDYQKLVSLLPTIVGEPYEEIVIDDGKTAQDELVAETAAEMYPGEAARQPLHNQRRMLNVLIDAWEGMLEVNLRDNLGRIVQSNNEEEMKSLHGFLVQLNREFIKDTRTLDEKKEEYIGRVKAYEMTRA